MFQGKKAELLENEIEALLVSLSDIDDFYELIKDPITKSRRGSVTENEHDCLWSLLPLMVCEAICGDYKHAIPVATTMQLLKAAAEVFDDIEDADSTESLSTKYNPAIATNAAATLLVLAEKEITRLKRKGVENDIIISVIEAINSYYTTACAGQHLDLSLTSEMEITEDLYFRIISMKSASQIECACYIGALLATANQELINIFAMFGHNLGIASQITNDIQGIISGIDINKRKITLPVIYALSQTDNKAHHHIELAFHKQSEFVPDTTEIRGLLFYTGAIHYATIKLELYKQRALDTLRKAETVGANVERLKLFLG